ncbi:MAG: pantoate--beta-alanine ligase [Candidatus Omnitrophica bacterium]|nr:pantoate--beta-alanine ligase [Candidatus Omnitrophota bacterium]MDD5671578.1 pantoate--beta-alanine ligase [Candidatus Omnitrophota bacterium]
MKIIRSPEVLQREMRRQSRRGREIGFVPTMGALHDGHLALVRRAHRENDLVVVSLFVNPTQFGPKEDFKRYPRPFREDCRKLRWAKVDYVFYPPVKAIYPEGDSAYVDFAPRENGVDLTHVLCGKFRPGHFRGVATVVAKLFCLVGPDRVYFGAKDYQQTVVVRRLIRDLHLGIKFCLCPTVREKDGLAMSSRNRYLDPAERRQALEISKTLFWIRKEILRGNRQIARLRRRAIQNLRKTVDRLQYLEIVDPESLSPLSRFQPSMVALVACYVGKTRLIDNVIIKTRPRRNPG